MDMKNAADTALVSGLVSSPIWADLLGNFNAFLTSLTLTAGLILGLIRLWVEGRRLLRGQGDA